MRSKTLGGVSLIGHFVEMQTTTGCEPPASANNTEAQFQLAASRLAQADSFESFESAAALVEEAARNGHAEATCMVATLEAVGAGRRQDWGRAFDYLELAAERGSEHARSQLRLLAGIIDPGGAAGQAEERDWRGARARIDLGRLLQVRHRAVLSESPRLRVFQGFASPSECRWVIDRLAPKLGPAMIWNERTGTGDVDPRRSNSAAEIPLAEMDVVIEVLRARISAATRLPEFIFEIPQLMHYAVGQEFKPHHDFLDPTASGLAADFAQRGQRILTFLIYLNEDFDGGETEFPAVGLSWRGGTGDALLLANVTPDNRPDPLTLHAGRPPTRGEKWILSQWIRNRAPGEAPANAPP